MVTVIQTETRADIETDTDMGTVIESKKRTEIKKDISTVIQTEKRLEIKTKAQMGDGYRAETKAIIAAKI